MIKRIFGRVFIVIAALFTLMCLASLRKIDELLIGLVQILMGNLDAYQSGYFIGQFICWFVVFSVTILMWQYGWNWIKKKVADKEE